jgi:cupin 2 domain-containing protein
MKPVVKNLFADLPASSSREDFRTLVQTPNVRVERIVSNGQCSAADFWYDQPEDEWVLLVQGTASLLFDDGCTALLKAGDYLHIARHVKHRVVETSLDAVWLAIYYST